MDAQSHFDRLFKKLVAQHGRLDRNTLTGIVGFSVGGPVSLSQIAGKPAFVTCELSMYPQQVPSTDGCRFELLCMNLDKELAWPILTALGNLSMSAQLGHGHTIDVSSTVPAGAIQTVRLSLYSRVGFLRPRYGIYQVLA